MGDAVGVVLWVVVWPAEILWYFLSYTEAQSLSSVPIWLLVPTLRLPMVAATGRDPARRQQTNH
jgi:hypothetical protein